MKVSDLIRFWVEVRYTYTLDPPKCDSTFFVDVDTMKMDGVLNCPYCDEEIKED